MYVAQFINLNTKLISKISTSYRQNIIRLILIQNTGNVHNCTYMHGHEHAAYSTVALRYTHIVGSRRYGNSLRQFNSL